MAEENILNITKLKITCKECGTEVITKIGRTIYACPDCNNSFNVNREKDYFALFKDVLTTLKDNNSADFSILCEEE